MIIVSNTRISKPCDMFLSYQEFIDRAFGEKGLDIDLLYMNINDVASNVFNDIKGYDAIRYFTLNGNIPPFALGIVNVEDWSDSLAPIRPAPSMVGNGNVNQSIADLIGNIDLDDERSDASLQVEPATQKEAKIYVFGSSKGGTGKTFTSIISTYRYAKRNPNQRIALLDFDIIDGQVGISIHQTRPTMSKYYTEYQKGYRDFKTLKNFAVKASKIFPQNVDFYLAPSSGHQIDNEDFWLNIIENCIHNYDVVVFDTGIDYVNIKPISYAYKIADKINLVTTTSIKSVNSVTKQIGRLKGELLSPDRNGNNVFSKEDEIAPRLNVIITQMVQNNEMNGTIYGTLSGKCNVVATFGVITESISQAEFYQKWDVFDKNPAINKVLDDIMA